MQSSQDGMGPSWETRVTQSHLRYNMLVWLPLNSLVEGFGSSFGPAQGNSIVFISLGCCNKGPRSGWLQTAEMYLLTVLEGRGLK